MIDENYITSQLLYQTSRKIRALQQAFSDFLIGEDENSPPKLVFKLVNRVCNSLLRRLNTMSVGLHEKSNHAAIQNEARGIAHLVDTVSQIYDVLRNSRDMEHLNFIARPLENLVKLVHYNTRIIITSVPEYNYTYEELVSGLVDLCTLIQGITESGLRQDDVPRNIVKLGFPAPESTNILSYSALAHEIAHFIYEVNNISKSYEITYAEYQYQMIERLVADSILKGKEPLIEEIARTELVDEITATVHSWVKETVCDCLALYIMGPAFLFALFQTLSLLGSIYREASAGKKSYPPPVLRFKHALRCLEKLHPFQWTKFAVEAWQTDKEFGEIQKEITAHLRRIEEVSSFDRLPLDSKSELALDLSEATLEKLHKDNFFEKSTTNTRFPTESFWTYLMPLYARLAKRIPINEAGSASASRQVPDFRIILNVGWIYHLVAQGKFSKFDSKRDSESYGVFCAENRLLKKSLELAEFHTLFQGGHK